MEHHAVALSAGTLLSKSLPLDCRFKQSDQKFEKNRQIFENVAKTVAKLQKLKLSVKNSCIKLHFNV